MFTIHAMHPMHPIANRQPITIRDQDIDHDMYRIAGDTEPYRRPIPIPPDIRARRPR